MRLFRRLWQRWRGARRPQRPRRRQLAVDVIAGLLKRLHRPVDCGALRPFPALFLENRFNQVGRNAPRIAPKLLDQFDIPKLIQVSCTKPASGNTLAVSAGIVVISGMKRLMQVTHLDATGTSARSAFPRRWLPGRQVRRRTDRSCRQCRRDRQNATLECPVPLLAAVPVRVPVAIGPDRRVGDIVSSEIIGVGGEDVGHLGSNPSVKKLVGDQCDSGMPFAAPSQERRWNKREDKEKGDEPDLQEPASRSSPRNPTSSAPNCTTACR